VLSSIFEASNENSLKAIPVVRVSFGDSALDAVQSIVGENERGYMLRITPAILDSPIIINNVVAAIGLPAQSSRSPT
jgi:hypothetical protein